MTTPQMNEEQLRDVLARVVPEAPDSVADPTPVVRAARVRRRTQVALAGGAVAVIAVAAVVGGRALTDDSAPDVAEEPSISLDPYSTVPCPEADALPPNGPLPDDIVAVRYCAVPLGDFPVNAGPPDALVEGVDDFFDAAGSLPAADSARCAAADYVASDNRLLVELGDGSLASVSAGSCQNVHVGARSVDAVALSEAFMTALDAQRDDFSYSIEPAGRDYCEDPTTYGPARPGRESIVAATWCAPSIDGEVLTADALALVADGWRQAVTDDDHNDPCLSDASAVQPWVLVRTDRGDLLRLMPCPPDFLSFYGWEQGVVYRAPLSYAALRES